MIIYIASLSLFIICVRILISSQSAKTSAIVYTIGALIIKLFFSYSIERLTLGSLILLVVSLIYFTLLRKIGGGILWWILVIIGALLSPI
jgi:hypothetical protein